MTIYLLEHSKPIDEIADVDIKELEKLIGSATRKVRELRKIRACAIGKASKDSGYWDKDYLKRLGVPFKPLKLVRKGK